MMIKDCKTLEELWVEVADINRKHFPENSLMPILGNGKTLRPKVMFVFINPTGANISSARDWKGPRFPFIGTRGVWKVFHRAGMLDDGLARKINDSKSWSLELTEEVLDSLRSRSLYLTNIVKWTGSDATLPDAEKIKLFLPILEREILIVQPQHVVAFGLIPFESMTGRKIKLGEYHSEAMKKGRLRSFDVQCGDFKTKVIPCYFPVGRGNPGKAVDILRLVGEKL